ncbi:MAG: glycosyltransferase family 2 protein, partial [Clostridia bacterium]|nr:glycosyltransferase family 2 protein [Clostridia bacterium]
MKVIIATQAYNAEDYLPQTIETVLNQTYTDFIYLLIDSASTDGTPQIMQEYAKKDSRIKYIHFDVNALGRCEQCAVKEDGDYYMALDSDDLLEPDCLERLVDIAKKTDADIVVTGT